MGGASGRMTNFVDPTKQIAFSPAGPALSNLMWYSLFISTNV
jgi:hypothetical protein